MWFFLVFYRSERVIPTLRGFLLDGDFFIGAALATSLVKLGLRHAKVASSAKAHNGLVFCRQIIKYFKKKISKRLFFNNGWIQNTTIEIEHYNHRYYQIGRHGKRRAKLGVWDDEVCPYLIQVHWRGDVGNGGDPAFGPQRTAEEADQRRRLGQDRSLHPRSRR